MSSNARAVRGDTRTTSAILVFLPSGFMSMRLMIMVIPWSNWPFERFRQIMTDIFLHSDGTAPWAAVNDRWPRVRVNSSHE
mmetsp:Transcript_35777/g.98927  ORF Transcript_35777/g.98927 Transcript_35777/m.98927 type:complete len:81 (-) Transcript_35777:1862-2104(-)